MTQSLSDWLICSVTHSITQWLTGSLCSCDKQTDMVFLHIVTGTLSLDAGFCGHNSLRHASFKVGKSRVVTSMIQTWQFQWRGHLNCRNQICWQKLKGSLSHTLQTIVSKTWACSCQISCKHPRRLFLVAPVKYVCNIVKSFIHFIKTARQGLIGVSLMLANSPNYIPIGAKFYCIILTKRRQIKLVWQARLQLTAVPNHALDPPQPLPLAKTEAVARLHWFPKGLWGLIPAVNAPGASFASAHVEAWHQPHWGVPESGVKVADESSSMEITALAVALRNIIVETLDESLGRGWNQAYH